MSRCLHQQQSTRWLWKQKSAVYVGKSKLEQSNDIKHLMLNLIFNSSKWFFLIVDSSFPIMWGLKKSVKCSILQVLPSWKRTAVFCRKLQYFAKKCSYSTFTLVFHYYIYFTVVYPCKTVVLPSLFFQN
jgi:hypothetical protein